MHCTVERNASKSDRIDTQIGKNLKGYRKICGLSQKELAETVGVTFQQLQKYEKGNNRISASRLYKLAETLNVSVADFYNGIPCTTGKQGKESHFLNELDKKSIELILLYEEIENNDMKKALLKLIKTYVSETKKV